MMMDGKHVNRSTCLIIIVGAFLLLPWSAAAQEREGAGIQVSVRSGIWCLWQKALGLEISASARIDDSLLLEAGLGDHLSIGDYGDELDIIAFGRVGYSLRLAGSSDKSGMYCLAGFLGGYRFSKNKFWHDGAGFSYQAHGFDGLTTIDCGYRFTSEFAVGVQLAGGATIFFLIEENQADDPFGELKRLNGLMSLSLKLEF